MRVENKVKSIMLEMTCERCAVQNVCPKKGSSPLFISEKQIFCHLIGGYGRTPVDSEILSEESKKLVIKYGPCLTIAEIPHVYNGEISFELIKIFSQPILSDREKTNIPLDSLQSKSFK
jgi:hypothetical protein